MQDVLALQEKLVPDVLKEMGQRYRILQYLRLMGPIGRRSLAHNLEMTEKVLRRDVEFLHKQQLISANVTGMMLTGDGAELLDGLDEAMREVTGLAELEQTLNVRLSPAEVIVVSGDSDREPWVKRELGRACTTRLQKELGEKNIITVAGGTTAAAVADMMTPKPKGKEMLFVPARGGLGEQVENQANTICAKMARKADGDYRLLHVPDPLSQSSYRTIVREPAVREVLTMIRAARIVIHGIGEAKTMATRRKSSPGLLTKLGQNHAVAEAFGYYLDAAGHIVHRQKTIGLQLDDLPDKETVISVAGGSSKAEAIAAFLKKSPHSILVTDEGAATALAKQLS